VRLIPHYTEKYKSLKAYPALHFPTSSNVTSQKWGYNMAKEKQERKPAEEAAKKEKTTETVQTKSVNLQCLSVGSL